MLPIKADADFAPLGEIEFQSLGLIFEFCEIGRKAASNTGLIIAQAGYDLKSALMTIPPVEGHNPARQAARVVRHIARAEDHARAMMGCFAKTPKVILKVYEQEIQALRRGTRRTLRLDA